MKVRVELNPDLKEPYATIHAKEMNVEIERVISLIQEAQKSSMVVGLKEEQMNVLAPQDIYAVRIENGKTVIYGEKEEFLSKKRLYQLKEQLGSSFMQTSKGVLINLNYLDHLEAGFGGSLFFTLKNGIKDYVSRTYLPDLKKYLGL